MGVRGLRNRPNYEIIETRPNEGSVDLWFKTERTKWEVLCLHWIFRVVLGMSQS